MKSDINKENNQCDGCQRNLPLQQGYHYDNCIIGKGNCNIVCYCTADRYTPPTESLGEEKIVDKNGKQIFKGDSIMADGVKVVVEEYKNRLVIQYFTHEKYTYLSTFDETDIELVSRSSLEQTPSWEEEFDRICGFDGSWEKNLEYTKQQLAIKNLISNLLTEQREEILGKVKEIIEENGHQQENDEIWCNMDTILDLIKNTKI
jgi:hypothetical protein